MAALLLILVLQSSAPDEAALWTTIHLTAQAAIEAGNLAQSRAGSPDIRNLGKLVVRDQGELDRRLQKLAAAAGIALVDAPKPARVQFEELRGLQGDDFNRKFLNFSYGACDVLRKQMADAVQRTHSASLRDLIAVFDPIVWQDQFLSGWCLGHCLKSKKP
jgi:hypothetical protein